MFARLVLASAFVAALGGGSYAQSNGEGPTAFLTIRGGVAHSPSEYPSTVSTLDETSISEGEYGMGGMGEVIFEDIDLFAQQWGLLLGAEASFLTNNDAAGGPYDNSCRVETFLGLVADCAALTTVDSTTWIIDVSTLATYRPPSDPSWRFGMGPTMLWIEDDKEADYLIGGGVEYFVDRDTSFWGGGLKVGAEKSFALIDSVSFSIEAAGAVVYGHKKTKISDAQTFNSVTVRKAEISDDLFVYMAEISPKLSFALDESYGGASLEIGGSYKHIWGPLFTENTTRSGLYPAGGVGEEDDDIGVLSAFVGLTIPLD